MDLGTKVKNALQPPHSQESSRGEVDHKTPGSYPDDDDLALHSDDPQYTLNSASSHQHNKLHKPGDTRAQTNTDTELPGDHRDDPELRSHETASGVPVGSAAHSGYAATQAHSGHLKNTTQAGEHPYWGDLPQPGRVYNTVVGHGSPEDDIRRHHGIEDADHTRLSPLITSNVNDNGATSQLSRPEGAAVATQRTSPRYAKNSVRQDGASAERDTTGTRPDRAVTSGIADQNKQDLQRTDDDTADRGHAGKRDGTLLGVFHRDHEPFTADRESMQDQNQIYHSSVQHEYQSKPQGYKGRTEDEHEERSSTVFYRDQSDKRDHRHEKKGTKDKGNKDSKPEKESKFAALFHRGGNDRDDDPGANNRQEQERQQQSDRAPAEGLATVGGLEAYDTSRRHRDEHDVQDRQFGKEHHQMPRSSGTGQYEDTKLDRYKEQERQQTPNRAPAAGLAAGGGFAAYEASGRHQDHDVQERRLGKEHHQTAISSEARPYDDPQFDQDMERKTEPVSTRAPAASLAAVGGLAAFHASKRHQDEHNENATLGEERYQVAIPSETRHFEPRPYESSSRTLHESPVTGPAPANFNNSSSSMPDEGQIETTYGTIRTADYPARSENATQGMTWQNDISETRANGPADPMNAGNVAPTSTSASGESVGRDNLSSADSPSNRVESHERSQADPDFTTNANEGKYNLLASGTPSGVKIGSTAESNDALHTGY